jgi:hypothetical protein
MLIPRLLKQARARAEDVLELERRCERAQADYHHAIRQLHLSGGTMREIAAALGVSHQRVGQIVGAQNRSWLQRLRELGAGERRLACSFCGESSAVVERLVSGPTGIYICDGCVRAARAVLDGGDAGGAAPLARIGAPRQRCSFCGKAAKGARQLVGTAAVRICTDCVPVAAKFAAEVDDRAR